MIEDEIPGAFSESENFLPPRALRRSRVDLRIISQS
jgi:hypothetical protein